jgi:pyruvate dehydrogenase E1 component beta subunit
LIVADDSHDFCGVASGISGEISDEVFYYLDAPIGRVSTPNVPLPFSPALEFPIIPSRDKIIEKVREMLK